MTVCRSCGAPIQWAHTATGGRMPLDPEPVPHGNVRLVDGVAHVLSRGAAWDGVEPRYRSHFATCPNATLHRRPR